MQTEAVEFVRNTAAEAGHHLWWEWQIPVYLFLGGMVAGLMIIAGWRVLRSKAAERSDAFRLLSWLAPILISLGMLALWLDLANRFNVLRFYLAFIPTSPMSWGSWILLIVYPVSILFALGELPDRFRQSLRERSWTKPLADIAVWASKEQVTRTLAMAGILTGIGLGIYTGVLLGAFSARPLWNTAILGPLFLVSGLSTGTALMMLFGVTHEERHLLGRIDLGLMAVELLLLGLFLFSLFNGGAVQREAAEMMLGGEFTAWFWSLVIFVGLLAPLTLEALELRGRTGVRWIAPALVLVGGLSLRWILVMAGQISAW